MKAVLFFLSLLFSCHQDTDIKKDASLKSSLKTGDIIALDVRTVAEVKNNPADGSINIPIDQLEQKLSELDPSKKVLVFCEVGGRASKAKKILMKRGFTDVTNIGSWRDWNSLKLKK